MPDRAEVQRSLAKVRGFIGEKTSSEYSPGRFYTRSTDDRGHREYVKTSLTPGDKAMLNEIVAMDRFPYRTLGDIIRDAIHHRCQYLLDARNERELIPAVLDHLAKRELEDYLASWQRQLSTYAKIKADARRLIASIEAADMPGYVLTEVLETSVSMAEKLREPLRGKLLQFLTQLGATAGLRAVDADPDDDTVDPDED